MSPEERQLLTALFDRIQTASSTPRDQEAETLIEEQTRRQPYAAYYLAQAVIVQEKGLEAASHRIKELEAKLHELERAGGGQHQGGGFLGSIFGSSEPQGSDAAGRPDRIPLPRQTDRDDTGYDGNNYRPPQQAGGPWGGGQSYGTQPSVPSAGSSFLRGALGTAAGVAGGMLLANSLSSVFSNHVSGLGWGSPMQGAPVEETVINNYYGDTADNGNDRQASDDDNIQQADYGDDDASSDFGSDDLGGSDDSLDI